MPELPEVEFARSVIERAALDRVVTEVDDSDTYVCRPHRPGDIRAALLGRRLTAAHRRGKTMWCDTDGGPVLGIHLGMSGKIVVADPDGHEIDGGDYWEGRRVAGDYRWARFTLTFADVPDGELILYQNSYGSLAVALNRGDAAGDLGLVPGTEVILRPSD